jgi:hypothetical protein
MPEAEIKTLTDIDPWLTHRVADWAVILALHQYRPLKIHGFITNDAKMLALSRTLPVLMQTELSLLVCARVGDDPVAATGLLLLHLPYLARRWAPHPEVVVANSPAQKPDELSDSLEVAATREGLSVRDFIKTYRPSRTELSTPLRNWYVPGS